MTRSRIGALAVIACIGTACAPEILWSRHTSDRLLALEVRRSGAEEWLVARQRRAPQDVRSSRRFEQIAFDDAVFSGDGRHFAVTGRRSDRWYVLRDLVEGPAFDGVAALGFDAGGAHLAYAAEEHAQWRVVVDGRSGPPWDGIGEPIAFDDSGTRLGYVAIDRSVAGCARVVVDGVAGSCVPGVAALLVGCSPELDSYIVVDGGARRLVRGGVLNSYDAVGELHDARCGARWAATVRVGPDWRAVIDGNAGPPRLRIEHLVFGPGGKLVAYAAQAEGGGWSMFLDGVEGPAFDAVGPPAFSPEGAHVGYIGERAGEGVLVIDGRSRPVAATALGLALGPEGRRFAYVAGRPGRPIVVCDGVPYPFPLVVEDTLSFSRDGRHWGALVGDPKRRELFVAVDGRSLAPFDTLELFGSSAGSGRPTELLCAWVAAEMEILVAEATAP